MDILTQRMLLSESYARLGETKQSIRVEQCGKIYWSEQEDGGKLEGRPSFCKDRLCPACSWRWGKSITKEAVETLYRVKEIDPDSKFLFLTLTVRSVPGPEISEALNTMAEGFNRFVNNRAFKRRVKGFLKVLGLKFNHVDGTFHFYYQLILCVSKSYKKNKKKLYWEMDDWARVWRQSARLTYDPHVWVREITGGDRGLARAARHLSRRFECIVSEDSDYTDQIVASLSKDLKHRRMVSFAGILSDARRTIYPKDLEQMKQRRQI